MFAKVFLLEDEPLIRELISEHLAELSPKVELSAFGNLDDFKSKLEKAVPDLVLIDVQLNGKMDGIEAAILVLKRSHACKIIFLSGCHGTEILSKIGALGLSNFITKPFTGSQIQVAVQLALGQPAEFRRATPNPSEYGKLLDRFNLLKSLIGLIDEKNSSQTIIEAKDSFEISHKLVCAFDQRMLIEDIDVIIDKLWISSIKVEKLLSHGMDELVQTYTQSVNVVLGDLKAYIKRYSGLIADSGELNRK